MVHMLASRAAGYKLGFAVFLLLIPIFYFGAVLSVDSLHKSQLARANSASVSLVDMTFRNMVDLASGWSVSDKQKDLLEHGPDLASQAGVTPEFEQFRDALLNKDQDRDVSIANANRLIMALGNGPLMNDAGNQEANAMAAAGAVSLPSVLIKYREMQALADSSMLSAMKSTQNLETMGTIAAELTLRAREFTNNIVIARSHSKAPVEYSFLQRNSAHLISGADRFKSVVFDVELDPLAKMQKVASVLRAANASWTPDMLNIWVELHGRLSAISSARASELRFWIAKTLSWSIASIVFSVGMCIRMFRSTLSKLDELEVARKESESARYIAESGSVELEKLNGDLAGMNSEVSQHLKALESAQEQLVKKGRMEQMGQLTATMAHELRNPLGAARTSIFLLERKTRGKGLGVESQIQRITNAIMRCDDIITQLLDFSRTKKLSPMSADFDSWLERIVTEEAHRLPQVITIACELGTLAKPIAFDPSRMQRAVTNLLNNATEAMVGNGEDSSKFAVTNPRIQIRSAIVGDMLELTISDNGPGISPENLARVREPLFTTKSFGTGLGLPAVEQIAAQHGGSMLITSELGHGTKATILLPLEAQLDAA